MRTTRDLFKKGDAVYYHNAQGDTIPTIIVRVGRVKVKLQAISLNEHQSGHPKANWVPVTKIEHQS